jgi:hypothetical protein
MLNAVFFTDVNAAACLRAAVITGQAPGPKWTILTPTISGTFLRYNGTDSLWSAILAGDLPSNIAVNLLAPAGTNGYVLTTVGGVTAWAASAGGIASGATLPATPTTGQLFLHTPTGRTILYEYSGAFWFPLFSYAALNIYVDSVNGVDNLNNGYAAGTSAFKTIAFAWGVIPAVFDGNVNIYLADLTYTENLILTGKTPGGPYSINIIGMIEAETTDQTVLSATQGSGSTQPQIVVSGNPYTGNAYQNMLLIFDANTTTTALQNWVEVIDSNGSNNIVLCGYLPAAPVAGDTFKVYTQGTIIHGYMDIRQSQRALNFQYIQFTYGGTTENILEEMNAFANFRQCVFNNTGNYIPLWLETDSYAYLYQCVIMTGASSAVYGGDGSYFFFWSCKIITTGSSSQTFGVYNYANVVIYDSIIEGTTNSGSNAGLTASGICLFSIFSGTSPAMDTFVRNYGTGILLNGGCGIFHGAMCYMVNVTTANSVANGSWYSA